MKKTYKYALPFAIVCSALLFASCEFGLGAQVDTDTPTVSIINPTISSVKGGSITIVGACNDDAGVSKVELSLRDKKGNTTSLGYASLNQDKTDWSMQTSLSGFSDGEYSIVATAIDGAERHATATREFNIDNTPPVVLLSKPNSFNAGDIGSGGYGKTVTVAGEILDDNDVVSLRVRVFKYDMQTQSEGAEVKLPYPEFTGFDVQGGLNVVIAQEGAQDEDDPESARRLRENYAALYDASGDKTQYFTMVVSATDAAGNTNTKSYIKSALNKVVSNATGVAVKNLISADYKQILGGKYTGDALDTSIVKSILDGTYPSAEQQYITSANGAHVIFSACPDSSPKYELTGYALTSVKEAERGATLGLAFEKGLDAKLIDPSSIKVYIYSSDDEGNITSTTPVFIVDKTNNTHSIFRNSGGTVYLTELTDPIDNSTFNFQLPSETATLGGGLHYKVVVEGTDTDGNNLEPKVSSGYGFTVSIHGGAPLVSCNDAEYGDGKYYKTAAFSEEATVKLKLNITDNSDDQAFGKLSNALEVTPILYTGNHLSYDVAEAMVASGKATRKILDPQKYEGPGDATSTAYITRDSYSESGSSKSAKYTATLPVSGINFAQYLGAADNYTLVLKVTANNGTPDTTYWCLYADGKAPVITVSNPWKPDSGTSVNENLITEADSYWQQKNATVNAETVLANWYTLRGFWSDEEGSGTKDLYFRTVPSSEVLVNDDILNDENKWTKVDPDDAPPDATSKIGINNSTVVREGEGWKIAIYATDNVGNKSTLITYSNITFDFGIPQITIPSVEQYYAKSDSPVEFVITAFDTNEMKDVKVTATLDGKTVTSGSNGYTVIYSDVVPRSNDIDATQKSSKTATIKIVRDGSKTCDGTWNFTVEATDIIGRKAEVKTFSTIVDSTLPQNVANTLKVDSKTNSASTWFSKNTLTLETSFKEKTSGLDAVFFLVKPNEDVDAGIADITGLAGVSQIAESGATGDKLGISVTPSTFKGGKNAVYIQTKDKAGNLSEVLAFNVNVDTEVSAISSEWYTYDDISLVSAKSQVLSNTQKPITVYGLVTDTESGIQDIASSFAIDGVALKNVTVTYSTANLTEDSTEEDFKNAKSTYVAYSSIADKATIKSWKAVIPAAQIKQGSVKVNVTDNAGNSTTQQVFVFNIDTQAPEVKLNSPEDKSSLNGSVSFTGTAKDTSLDFVELLYSYSKTGTYTSLGRKDDSEAYNWMFENVVISYTEDGVTKLLGGTTYTASKPLYIKVLAQDTAGNQTSSVFEYTADPDTDRPVVTLSNITGDGSTLLKSNTIYGSVYDDDGTIENIWYIEATSYEEANKPSESDDNGWTKVTTTNGNFNIEDNEDDGNRLWYFYIIDKVGTAFETKQSDKLLRPYIKFVDGTAKVDNTSGVAFSIDREAPEILDFMYSRAPSATTTKASSYSPSADGDDKWTDEDKFAFGGTSSKMYVKVVVKEKTGMKEFATDSSPIALTLDSKTITLTSTGTNANVVETKDGENYTYIIGPIDVGSSSGFDSALKTLEVTVTDRAGTEVSKANNVVIDNTAPSVKITSPLESALAINNVTMRGSITDNSSGSGVASVKYYIPTKTEAENISETSVEWIDTQTTSSLVIEFNDSGTPGSKQNIMTYANDTYAEKMAIEGQYKVPVYFLVKDLLGNTEIIKDKFICADTEAGKPVATIISPEQRTPLLTVGASFTVRGTAYDDQGVESVRLQLDVTGDGNYTEADYNVLNTTDWLEKNGWTPDTDLVASTSDTANDWYIKTEGTNSWKATIKVPDSYVKVDDSFVAKEMGIRACAYDSVPQSRGWLSSVTIKVDKNTPTVEEVKLVRKDNSGNVVEERDITGRSSGIYISGKDVSTSWTLDVTVADNDAVKQISVKNNPPDGITSNIAVQELNLEGLNDKTYNFALPLTTSADGTMYFKISVYDENTSTEEEYSISVDNTAPQMYTTGSDLTDSPSNMLKVQDVSNESAKKTLNSTDISIQNNNGRFTFGDTVEEDGSGLAYLAFYFKRVSDDNGNRVYNPMFEVGTTNANRTNLSAANMSVNDDGLVVLSLTGTRSSESSFTSASLKNNKNIRKGGLVKLGGVYRLITDASDRDTTGTIEFTPSINKTYTAAEFVYAQVVDSSNDETINNEDGDGDEMIEFVNNAGSAYTWTAKVDSSNIPDGPIELHVVSIDEAGNVSHGWCETNIQNNRPRIAKLLVGTDLNGNGKMDLSADAQIVNTIDEDKTANGTDFGEFRYYSTLDSNGNSQYDIAITTDSVEDTFTVKDNLLILPEFTGGNTAGGALVAWYKFNETSQIGLGSGTKLPLKTEAEAKALVNDDATTYVSSYGALYLENSTLQDYESRTNLSSVTKINFAVTFWDTTEETTQGVNSQWAHLTLPLVIDVKDDEVPVPEITPFYWKSAKLSGANVAYNVLEDTSNSVYKDTKGNSLGHIELEDDWAKSDSYSSTATSGWQDGDAKVSGIIRIQGRAYDAKRLGNIRVKIGNGATGISLNGGNVNTETLLATYAPDNASAVNNWTLSKAAATVEDDGWQFAIQKDQNIQSGHTVWWELDIDTSKVKNTSNILYAALDQLVTVTAYDASDKTASATYQVDIVPYVTGVATSMDDYSENNTSVYSRTALCHYPVYTTRATGSGEVTYDSVTVTGYNLTGASATVGGVAMDKDGLKFTVTAASKSGNLELTVNDVPSLNNKNWNDSHGSFTYAKKIGPQGDATAYANYYNRQPNGENNNILTDDIVLDIWDFNSKAAMGYRDVDAVANVVMKINPSNGLIGFAFSNGASEFSMPNKTNSYERWSKSYDYMGYTAMTADAYGYSYTVAVGGDISASGARDKFSLMTNRWGVVGHSQGSNGGTTNHIRLDTIGQGGAVDKARFQGSSMTTYAYTQEEENYTNLYLAYYDLLNEEIRFKVGTFDYNNDLTGTFSELGGDRDTDYNTTSGACQIVAASNNTTDTLGAATEYLSIAATPDGKAVVMVWYDGTNLLYSYTDNPLESASNQKRGFVVQNNASWKSAQTLYSDGGEYCKVAVGSDGSVHVAAYDSANANLIYVYLPSYDSTSKTVSVVDSYLDVGSNLTLDVAKVGDYQIPYIGYWGSSPELPRYAYLAVPEKFYDDEVSADEKQGTINDMYTGIWECTVVPSPNETINEGTMNVGVWKNASGELAYSTYSGETSFSGLAPTGDYASKSGNVRYGYSSTGSEVGVCYGNGSNNGVLAYVAGYDSYVETAQRR